MRLLLSYAIDFISAAVFLIPILLVLGKTYLHDAKRCVCHMLFALYLAAVCVVVGMPSVTSLTFDPTIEAVPFISMIEDAKNCILNVILFVPLGLFLPLLWEKFGSLARTALFGFGVSLAVELCQLFTFRTTDIDDLITNTAGTIVGFFIYKLVSGKKQIIEPSGNTRDVYILCGIVLVVMFLLQPITASLLWEIVY